MKKPNARQRLLDTAAKLFTQRGYAVVGINEIIEKAETAKASFYHHFPSKEDLCTTWLEETHDRSVEYHRSILLADGDPQEKATIYFEALKAWLVEQEYRGCPYTNTAASIDTGCAPILNQVEVHKLSIRDFFIDLALQVTPVEDSARELGTTLFLLYSGATTEAQNLRASWPVDAAITAAKHLLEEASSVSA